MPIKLVRDRVPEIMEACGVTHRTRIAPAEERMSWLLAKLLEEAREVIDAPSIEECADVLEVVHAIARELGYNEVQLRQEAALKAERQGRFDHGILLESGGDKG